MVRTHKVTRWSGIKQKPVDETSWKIYKENDLAMTLKKITTMIWEGKFIECFNVFETDAKVEDNDQIVETVAAGQINGW